MYSANLQAGQRPSQATARCYGNTTVKSGGHAILGDVVHDIRVSGGSHNHYYVKEIGLLHDIVERSTSNSLSLQGRQKVLAQLETLENILLQAEQMETSCDADDTEQGNSQSYGSLNIYHASILLQQDS